MYLLQGDAKYNLPFPDQSKDVVFGSRVFHLLDPVHVVHETLRVLTPTIGTFVMGKVKRDKQSPKDRFRTKMRELLIEYGAQPRPSEKRRAGILDQLEKAGMHTLATQTIYSWETTHRPIDSISNWAQKDTMGGIVPPQAVKEKVLTSLRQWALDVYGDLDKDVPTQEHYILEMATFDKQ
ncbi:MAG: methyltransferase domain-containing protein [Bdellovibrionota bacterium]